MSDHISAVVTEAKINESLTLIEGVKKNLPFLIKLDNNVKKGLTSMDDSRIPFVGKCLQYAKKEKMIVPPYVDITELEKDYNLFTSLQNLSREINRLADMINDTRIAAGSDAYVASLSLYNSVKQAAKMNVPGTKPIVDDLKKTFDSFGPTSKPTEE